jgi:TctA family transporter
VIGAAGARALPTISLLLLSFTRTSPRLSSWPASIGAQYGGSITAILVRIPAKPHLVACLDGYAMARQGRAGAALGAASARSSPA